MAASHTLVSTREAGTLLVLRREGGVLELQKLLQRGTLRRQRRIATEHRQAIGRQLQRVPWTRRWLGTHLAQDLAAPSNPIQITDASARTPQEQLGGP